METIKWEGRKLYSLIDKIVRQDNLKGAWQKVKKNGGGCGIDKVTISEFELNIERNLEELRRKVLSKSYESAPIRRVWIPKPDGGKRPLGIPTVEDRVLHAAIARTLYDVFEDTFESYGYMEGIGARDAIEEIKRLTRQGYKYALETDIEGFFDNLEHDILIDKIHERITDGTVLRLVRKILRSKVLGEIQAYTAIGTPQGSPLSPILANIYLAEFDRAIDRKYKIIRYADDVVILTKSKEEAEDAKEDVKKELADIGLKMKDSKTRVAYISEGWNFLGYEINEREVRPSQKSIKRFKAKVRKITMRKRTEPVGRVIKEELRPLIIGWSNYFKSAAGCKELFFGLGAWTIDRVKMYIIKARWIPSMADIKYSSLIGMGLILPLHVITEYVPRG